jgi:hypothetical protein
LQSVPIQQIPHAALAIVVSQTPNAGHDIDEAISYSRLSDSQVVIAMTIEQHIREAIVAVHQHRILVASMIGVTS